MPKDKLMRVKMWTSLRDGVPKSAPTEVVVLPLSPSDRSTMPHQSAVIHSSSHKYVYIAALREIAFGTWIVEGREDGQMPQTV